MPLIGNVAFAPSTADLNGSKHLLVQMLKPSRCKISNLINRLVFRNISLSLICKSPIMYLIKTYRLIWRAKSFIAVQKSDNRVRVSKSFSQDISLETTNRKQCMNFPIKT